MTAAIVSLVERRADKELASVERVFQTLADNGFHSLSLFGIADACSAVRTLPLKDVSVEWRARWSSQLEDVLALAISRSEAQDPGLFIPWMGKRSAALRDLFGLLCNRQLLRLHWIMDEFGLEFDGSDSHAAIALIEYKIHARLVKIDDIRK